MNIERWVEYVMNWTVIYLNEGRGVQLSFCWFKTGPKSHVYEAESDL